MMNTSRSISIPRTDRFMERLNTRMKFLLGNNVRIDAEYYGWDTVDGERYDGCCRTIQYQAGHLYVLEKGVGGVAVLWGDIADSNGRLIADRRIAHYNTADLRKSVAAYMEKNGIAEYTSEVGRHALWVKMMPQSLIIERVKVYEMTKYIS